MRGFPKAMFSVAAATLAAGVALTVTGLCLGGRPHTVNIGWSDNGLETHIYDIFGAIRNDTAAVSDGAGRSASTPESISAEATQAAPQGDIRKLDIEIGGAELIIQEGDAFLLEVKGTNNYKDKVKNGVWNIEHTSIGGSNIQFIVTIPEGYVFEDVDIECGAGVSRVEGLSTAKLDVETGAGEIVFNDLAVTQSSDFEVGLGVIEVSGGDLQGKVKISCGMGSASFAIGIPDDFGYRVECGAGSVHLNGESFSGLGVDRSHNTNAATVYDIECGMGSVEVIDG